MSMTTGNTTALVRSNVWSQELKEVLIDDLQALGFVRYLPDFMGTTLNIPSIGEATVKDYVEDTAVQYDALDTGNFTFTINQYLQSGNYITEKARQDLFYASQLESSFVPKERRAIMEKIETDIFAITQDSTRGGQTTANANTINGCNHRWVGNGTNETIDITDFARANYSLNKANVPVQNRVAIVDQSVGFKLETLTNIANVSNNPMWEGLITTGIYSGMRFSKSVYGFDVYVSNYLPDADETIGSKTTAAGVSNLFFCADQSVTPFLFSWKMEPRVDGQWNQTMRREEYTTVCRYGVSIFRPENLVCVLTDTDQVTF